MSRADLARKTGLSRSTISAIVSELLQTGLVSEGRTGESRGGRKPIMLAFHDAAYDLIGIDMGATHVGVLVTNLRAQVRYWREKSQDVRGDPRGTFALIERMIDDALRELRRDPSQVLGIGVAVPSPVNPGGSGELLELILPKWKGYNIAAKLSAVYDLPVFVDNDANLGALAEVWWGGRPAGLDLAFIKIGLGVGAGLIIDGRIHRGRTGMAGEIGHTSLDPAGPRCICGLNGCLNTLLGSKHLLDRARRQAEAYPESPLAKSRRRLTMDRLVDAGLQRDPLACEVINFAGQTLGVGIANLLNLLAPDVVVLGGGLSRAGDLLLGPLKSTVAGMSLASSVSPIEIEISDLGKEGVALGAATMALETALDDPALFQGRRLVSA